MFCIFFFLPQEPILPVIQNPSKGFPGNLNGADQLIVLWNSSRLTPRFFPQNTIFYLYLIVSLNHADDAEEGHSEIQ